MADNIVSGGESVKLGIFRIENGGWQENDNVFSFKGVVYDAGGFCVERTHHSQAYTGGAYTGMFTKLLNIIKFEAGKPVFSIMTPEMVTKIEWFYNAAPRTEVILPCEIVFGTNGRYKFDVTFSVPTEEVETLKKIWEEVRHVCLMHSGLTGGGPEHPSLWEVGYSYAKKSEQLKLRLERYLGHRGAWITSWTKTGPWFGAEGQTWPKKIVEHTIDESVIPELLA